MMINRVKPKKLGDELVPVTLHRLGILNEVTRDGT
jgi:hypothetical protein